MTALRAAIVFNNSTGSDTAASGLGPATAVADTAAAHTSGALNTSITLLNSPDLSGVQVGDLLWLKTASGRQFSVISFVDNGAKTLSVDNGFTISSGSPVDYAIGGKRATLDNADSRMLLSDLTKTDYNSFEIEYTGTNYTLSSVWFFDGFGGGVRITGTGGRPTIEQTANAGIFHGKGIFGFAQFIADNLRFINTNATKTSAYGLGWNDGSNWYVIGCIFGSDTSSERLLTSMTRAGGSESRSLFLFDCQIINTTSNGFLSGNANINTVSLIGCHIRDCAGNGILVGDPGGSVIAINTVIENCGGRGICVNGQDMAKVINCTIHGNGSHGIQLNASAGSGTPSGEIINNNITGNNGYGIIAGSNQSEVNFVADYNNFGTGGTANVSGPRQNFPAGVHDLAVDPGYTSVASSDFSIGPNVKALGFPIAPTTIGADQSGTKSYVDIGAAQRQERGPQARFILGV